MSVDDLNEQLRQYNQANVRSARFYPAAHLTKSPAEFIVDRRHARACVCVCVFVCVWEKRWGGVVYELVCLLVQQECST
jgi:hypothetical protein